MQREEFEKVEKQVKAQTVTALHPYIPMALEILGDTREHHHFQVSDVVEVTDRLASILERMEVAEGQPEQGEVPAKPSVTNEFLDDLITPWIQDIRQEIFNTRVPQFRTPSEAFKWLDEGSVHAKNWLNELQREKDKTIPKWMKSPYPGYLLDSLDKLNPKLDSMLDNPPPYLVLFNKAKEVARVTWFSPASVMFHIVAGTPLILDKVNTKAEKEIHELPSGEELVNRFVTVQIRGELSLDELRHLYQQIRQDLGVKRSKALNDTHLELYQLVKKRGGPVKGKGSVTFWKQVMEDWNKKHEGDPYKIWKSAKRAYDLLWDKLRSQHLVEGGKTK